MKEVDFLVVGQGIAGTVFCHKVLEAGYTCHVVDKPLEGRASEVAGGLINPITGRFMKKSWMVDELMPVLKATYASLDSLLGIKSYQPMPILRLLAGTEEVNNWEIKRNEPGYALYMGPLVEVSDERLVPHAAAGEILQGGWLNTRLLLTAFRRHLQEKGMLTEEEFRWEDLEDSSWRDISFKQVIACEGFRGRNHPFFPSLPLQAAKGQVMTIEVEGPDFKQVYNKNMLMIPLGHRQYKIGATVEHTDDARITSEGLHELEQKAASVLRAPYRLISQEAGIRPTVRDRRPLLGKSPLKDNVYIFNGLGTKGVSLAPYFAEHLLKHITQGSALMKEVDVARFS